MPAAEAGWELPAHRIHELAPRRHRYCVGIPVLDEGERFRAQIERMSRQGVADLADIAVFDGNSRDGSTDPGFLKAHGVRTLLVKTGPGRLSAQLRMGYAYVLSQGYDGVVTIDGNGKDGTEAIGNFLAHLDDGWDFVQGSRYIAGGQALHTPVARTIAIRLLHVPLTRLAAGFRYTDTTNGFRGYSRRLLLDPGVQPFRAVFDSYELLAYLSVRAPRLGFRVVEIPVRREYPPREKPPTKIGGMRGNIAILSILLRAAAGRYDPVAAPARTGTGTDAST